MSEHLYSELWNREIKGPKRELLFALSFEADDDGTNCYSGIDSIAKKIDKSETQIRRLLKALVRDGSLIQTQRGNGRHNLSDYKIDLEAIKPKMPFEQWLVLQKRKSQKDFIDPAIRWAVWERDNFTCLSCGTRKFLSVDHIIPESKGGLTEIENLQTLCKTCNSRKGDRV